MSKNRRGETIVEVLIAIAVVSSVMGIAYSIMNRNIQILRDNQERTEASKIAQSQLELLRVGLASDNTTHIPTDGAAFCMLSSTASRGVSNPENFDTYGEECSNGLYHYSMKRNASDGYTVAVIWDALGGGRSQVVMAYKAEQ